jgi:hypothetical protein
MATRRIVEKSRHYVGERGRRGKKLPKGNRKADRIEILRDETDNNS